MMNVKCYITDKYENHKLSLVDLDVLKPNEELKQISITLNPQVTYQSFIGFGGSFTEASGYNLSRVSPKIKEEALKLYFSEDGLNYTLGRIAIGGCDFSLGSYSYIDDYDESLSSFSIERDQKYIISIIKKAFEIKGEPINILASPWSPPFWMKDNNLYNYGGKLKKEYYLLYAKYLLKFIKEYEKMGILIKAITLQNEPAAIQRWDSCLYSEYEEKELLEVVGKLFEKENVQTIIYVWDHNRDIVLERVKPIYESEVGKYAYGTAIHWYDNEPFDNLKKLHQLYPDKHVLHTEGCIEGTRFMGLYEAGERYARNIIGDFNNFTEGFIDWNLFLDETGGPNWVNNLCDAPIILKIGPEEIVKEYSYYAIGHFSKFIKVNAKKIAINCDNDIPCTAFINPDNSIVIVVLNENEEDKNILVCGLDSKIEIKVKKKSITTLVYEGDKNYE